MNGFSTALLVGAVVLFAASGLVAVLAPGRERTPLRQTHSQRRTEVAR